jgi:anthranilate synthase/aminodeoxychorismate synthase-like glutamine amidotransferase
MHECQRVSGPPRLVRGRPLRGTNRIECLQRMLKPAVPSPPLAAAPVAAAPALAVPPSPRPSAAPSPLGGSAAAARELAEHAGPRPPALRVLVVDNYDSFTFNLVQYLGELGAEVEVFKNDGIDVAGVRARQPHGLLISPGPCTPNEAGISLEILQALGGSLPILGVCLGHQAIGQAYGGRVVRAGRLMHGKTSPILHDGRGLFDGIASPFEATRYHSLLVERASLPACLEISAWTAEGEIMGLRHREHAIEGVQFHPESILTREGKRLVGNWLKAVAATSAAPARGRVAGSAEPAPAPPARGGLAGPAEPAPLGEGAGP